MKLWIAAWLLLPALALADQGMRLPPETVRLNRMAARFAPVDIRVELSGMPASDWKILTRSLLKSREVPSTSWNAVASSARANSAPCTSFGSIDLSIKIYGIESAAWIWAR